MLNGTWSLDNISFVLPDDVLKAIKATPIRRSARRGDQRCWVSSASGEFDTKSAYLLAINEDVRVQDFNGKWLWKLCILPKIKFFLWKCYHHSLPVNAVLGHRGIDGLGGCSSCLDPDETIVHVLRDCPVAQGFWRLANCPTTLWQSFAGNFLDWLHINSTSKLLTNDKDYPWCLFFLLGIWYLWLQRNRKIFGSQCMSSNGVQKVEMQTREFFYCIADPRKRRTKVPRLIKWLKPPVGWWKLNTDGSFLGSSGVAGGGGLIRDSRGQCIGGFAKAFAVTSCLAAELWALRDGLLLCLEMQAQAVVVELDAIAAVSLISNNACTNGDFSILVDDCRDLLLQLPQTQILHCFREANSCADALARMGSASCDVEMFFVTPPPTLLSLLNADMLGVYHPRPCTALADLSS